MTNEYFKNCPECQKDYEAKRLNQVYCSQKCKTRFNNRKVRLATNEKLGIIENTNSILWKNRELLSQYANQTISIHTINQKGFDKNFITRFSKIEVEGKKKNCSHIYDYYFYFLDSNSIKIGVERATATAS